MLPNKPRGVRRVNDRRMLNGILWVLRSGAPWRHQPETYGPCTTCYNRFVRWRRLASGTRSIEALAAGNNAAVQMIDTSVVRVHQHGACDAAPQSGAENVSFRHCEEQKRRSNPEFPVALDCFAEPVMGRAFARPVGSQ
jgi:transposase